MDQGDKVRLEADKEDEQKERRSWCKSATSCTRSLTAKVRNAKNSKWISCSLGDLS
jgi:hypothetical protein